MVDPAASTALVYTVPGSWAQVHAVRATVYFRGAEPLQTGPDVKGTSVTGLVQINGPWVRIRHKQGTVIAAFDQVASIVEAPE